MLQLNCHTCGRQLRTWLIQQRRHKSKYHWTNIEKRNFPRFKALDHFDDFYKSIYGENLWRSLRLGLLCNNKYCAVVNNYSEPDSTMQELESRGALNMRRLFEVQLATLSEREQEADEENSQRVIKEMEDKIDSIIMQKAKSDKLSNLYGQYEKATEEDKLPRKFDESELEVVDQLHSGKRSLAESLKDATLDHSRIIHPKQSITLATLDEYIPCTKIRGLDEWVSETEHYDFYRKSLDFPINVDTEEYLAFPKHLNVYTYEKCNVTSFPQPKPGSTGVLDYYLLDGGSILPILVLNLQKGDRMLDMCGAPGGKALTAMQTLMLDELVCNDISQPRVNRIEKVMKEYFYSTPAFNKFSISKKNAATIIDKDHYNKILVDVPCTNDRVSVNEDENNYFASNRVKERLQIPEIQASILTNALKLVVSGGTVVYSTCSLSPIQNDGVIQMALKKAWEETNFEFVVKDLTKVLKPANIVYYLGTKVGMKYGVVVLPHLTANFGPLYVSKIERIK